MRDPRFAYHRLERHEHANVARNYGILIETFLPLGLPESRPFWTERAERWSSQLVWEGADVPKDNRYINLIHE
jgi:hypothetical protein